MSDDRTAAAVAEILRQIPGGSERATLGAMALLAEQGDEDALRAVEAHLAAAPLSVSYGDRDSDPPPWELGPQFYALLARWWERLGLADERAAWLASDWLLDRAGPGHRFGANGHEIFTRAAPHIAPRLAPLLVAAASAGSASRRARAANGLQYTPTGQALDALVQLLGDPVERVANEARSALGLLAHPPSPGSARRQPSAPEAVAERLLGALGSASPAVRRRALAALAWFAGATHRNQVKLPPAFDRALPAVAGLLADPDPEVRRLAAQRIDAAGPALDSLRPSAAASLDLRLPALDLLPLLDSGDPASVRVALYLAGRAPLAGGDGEELGARILALLAGLERDPLGYRAAAHALARLDYTPAIQALARHLEGPAAHLRIPALLALARLRYPPAIPHLVRLLRDLTYRQDAREALEWFDPAQVLPAVLAQVRASARDAGDVFRPEPWEVSYLEAHGDAEALGVLRQSEAYHYAARYAGGERDGTVAAARRLERRLLLAAGAREADIDDPVAAVRRILTGPLHPVECEPRGDARADPAHGELRARWRNLCVALDGWLLAEPPPALPAAIATAEPLLERFPDEVREAHERWWLDVVRGGQIGLPRVSAVARARLSPKAPWALARALVINEGIAAALDPAECLAWPGMRQIRALTVDHPAWLRALAAATAEFAPSSLSAGIADDAVAALLLAWPGLERLERLEICWSNALSDAARAALHARTLAARRRRVWHTPAGTFLVPRAFAPVHSSAGRWIVRPDGSALAVGGTYAEVAAGGELKRTYGGPLHFTSPEEYAVSEIYTVVGDALRRAFWHEGRRQANGVLGEQVVLEGLVEVEPADLPAPVAALLPRP